MQPFIVWFVKKKSKNRIRAHKSFKVIANQLRSYQIWIMFRNSTTIVVISAVQLLPDSQRLCFHSETAWYSVSLFGELNMCTYMRDQLLPVSALTVTHWLRSKMEMDDTIQVPPAVYGWSHWSQRGRWSWWSRADHINHKRFMRWTKRLDKNFHHTWFSAFWWIRIWLFAYFATKAWSKWEQGLFYAFGGVLDLEAMASGSGSGLATMSPRDRANLSIQIMLIHFESHYTLCWHGRYWLQSSSHCLMNCTKQEGSGFEA